MKISLNGYVLAVISVIFWSFNVLISHYMAGKLAPFQIAFGRWSIAALVLIPFTLKSVIAHKKVLKIHWKRILVMSLCAVVLQNTIVYQAGKTAAVINMALLGTVGPIFLVIFSKVFLHTTISLKQIFGFCIALCGVLTIISKGHFSDIVHIPLVPGDFWMLLMTVVFGIYGVLQTQKIDIPPLTLLATMIFTGLLILIPIFCFSLFVAPIRYVPVDAVLMIVYLGLFPSIISYLCWNIALGKIGALKTGLIYYLMPVLSTIEAYFLIGEKIITAQLIGGSLVIGGVFITAYHHPKHQVEIHRV